MTDIELLPIAVSPYTDRILAAARKQDGADPLFRILEDYACANVAHATAAQAAEIEALKERDEKRGIYIREQWAEIETLRAEVERLEEIVGGPVQTYDMLKARAERLAEALDTIARVGKASRNQTTRTRWIVARAVSALNGDNDWQALPKPKGFHGALLHDQEVGNG